MKEGRKDHYKYLYQDEYIEFHKTKQGTDYNGTFQESEKKV